MSSSQSDVENPVKRWVLLTGSRTGFAIGLTVCIVVLSAVLSITGIVYVKAGSNLATALASGLLSGLLTLITVTLSINQLILSRVFGSPSNLTDTVEGSIEFQESVERIADVPISPNDPDEFLALIGRTLIDHAEQLHTHIKANSAFSDDFEQFTKRIITYGDHLANAEDTNDPFEVLVLTLGTGYAQNLTETRRLQAVANDLSDDADETLDDILTLLKGVATMRQFFKTLTIQQDLARLSRQLIYTGVAAVLITYYLSHVYTSASSMPTAIPEVYMPLVTSVAAGVIFLPLMVIISYLLRVATVTFYTVSVGSFVPPIARIKEQ
ncbi:hypothetical protein [Haladaptatus halobius]|uniref:hypothetical protein n=1 Tax=Haladaptatus halobius TaxID=2884875 RepID=UPI001D0AAC57|nr:hypothetical protein [Haladaptatus halobius]